ncbi:MAG: baseplate J/gp47 family protein [Clostridia bacterium]|jgi:uncharacterized phage protein gp47/JayE|nr:baseplate J/gp47 family protein [Clostridia bacterium]
MFEDITVESIKEDILGNINDFDTREGSFADILIGPAALEFWKLMQSMNSVIPIAFVDETSGEYIDKRAAEFGLTRKSGTYAKAEVTFSGSDGALIKSGTVILDTDSREFILQSDVTINGTTGTGNVQAAEIGSKYNSEAGSICKMYKAISGVTSVTNESAAEGGTDDETDSSFVQRLYEYWQKPATSGNVYHYKQWALSVEGVGGAKIFPLWNGNGTVKVIICDSNKELASESIINACAAYIEENRPIGADVTVVSAVEKNIEIAMTLLLNGSKTLETITSEVKNSIESYIKSIAFSADTLLYNRIAYIILDNTGVTDYKSLTVNGQTSNIAIADNEIAILGTCEVSGSE